MTVLLHASAADNAKFYFGAEVFLPILRNTNTPTTAAAATVASTAIIVVGNAAFWGGLVGPILGGVSAGALVRVLAAVELGSGCWLPGLR